MTTIQTASAIYAIDERTGDIVDLPERTGKKIEINKHKPYIATPEDIARELQFKEMQKEKHFFAWIEDEHHRVSTAYRNALLKEIEGAKQVSSNISNDLPIIMESLRSIKVPGYNKYEGTLSKEKQLKFYNQMSKPDFNKIFHETIKNNLC